MLYVFVHRQFAKPIFRERIIILAVDLSVLIYQGNNELLGLRNDSIVNLTVLSYCISNCLLPSLKGHRSL